MCNYYHKFTNKASDGDLTKRSDALFKIGVIASTLEHSVPEQMYGSPNNFSEAVSTMKAFELAMSEGQRLYQISASNMSAFDNTHHDTESMNEITTALNNNQIVITHTNPVQVPNWEGSGYIIFDKLTGDGAYKITGGSNGGIKAASNMLLYASLLGGRECVVPVASSGYGGGTTLLMSMSITSILVMGTSSGTGGCQDDETSSFIKHGLQETIPFLVGGFLRTFEMVDPSQNFAQGLIFNELTNVEIDDTQYALSFIFESLATSHMVGYGLASDDLYTAFFVAHYFYGNGQNIQLSDIRLDHQFETNPEISNAKSEFYNKLHISNCEEDTSDFFGVDLTWHKHFFAIGGIALKRIATCNNGTCHVKFILDDPFKDPFDGERTLGFPYELPGGNVYHITHEINTVKLSKPISELSFNISCT